MIDLVKLCAHITRALDTLGTSIYLFVAGYENQLNEAFDEIARAERLFSTQTTKMIRSVRIALRMNTRGPTLSPLEKEEILSLKASVRDFGSGEDAYTRFYNIASISSRQNKCWARGCQRYGELDALKLMRCARCRAVQYCSRDCQRLHWKDDKRPHKAVCETLFRIQNVSSFTTGNPDPRAFSIACRNAGIQLEELMRPYYHFLSIEIGGISDDEGVNSTSLFSVYTLLLIHRSLVVREQLEPES